MRTITILLFGLLLAGCRGEEPSTPRTAPGGDVPKGAGTQPAPAAPGGPAELPLPESPALELGVVSIRGTVLDAKLFGPLQAGERLRADLRHASGAKPKLLGVWLGVEALDAAEQFAAAEAGEKLFRAVWTLARTPEAGDRLWLEVTMPNGSVARGSLPLPAK